MELLSSERLQQVEEAEQHFFEQCGLGWPYKPPMQKLVDVVPGKVLVVADPHAPYDDKTLRDEFLKHKDAETVIVQGDVFDGASKSRFRQMEHVDFNEEIRGTMGFLEFLYANFHDIRIMKGNHDNRAEKKIAELLSDGHTDLLALTEGDLLGRLCAYLSMPMVGLTLPMQGDTGTIKLGHIYQMGDAIFLHAERSQAQESGLLKTLASQVDLWAAEFGLKPWRILLQAHNHARCTLDYGDKLLMLVPCAMNSRSNGGRYVFNPKFQYRPSKRGYTILWQENGVTDFNRTYSWVAPRVAV